MCCQQMCIFAISVPAGHSDMPDKENYPQQLGKPSGKQNLLTIFHKSFLLDMETSLCTLGPRNSSDIWPYIHMNCTIVS